MTTLQAIAASYCAFVAVMLMLIVFIDAIRTEIRTRRAINRRLHNSIADTTANAAAKPATKITNLVRVGRAA